MTKKEFNITINVRGFADEKTVRNIEKVAMDFIKQRPEDPTKLKKRLQL
jgi:formiminotetrahydrofolate cyclodeaminase